MSYRKIVVKGKEYEYVIGSTFLKIKGLGLFKKSEIGNQIRYTDEYVVSPQTVKRVILGEPLPQKFTCESHGITTTLLRYNPFDAEIYQRYVHMMDCERCYNNYADEI